MPHPSPRQWFWSLTAGLFLWAYVGNRMLPAGGERLMLQSQQILAAPVELLMVPGSWLVSSAQHGVVGAIRSITAARQDTRTVASLEEQIRELEDDVRILKQQNRLLVDQIRVQNARVAFGIPPADLLKAYVTGRNLGDGVAQLNVDKGTADGVREGMEVIAGENCIVGRVLETHAKTSVIRLITDHKFKVRAMIVRAAPGENAQPLLKETCLVEGLGNGQFYSDTIKTLDTAIAPGDIVELRDDQWPAKLQFFILGTVSEVGLNPRQMLRYEVRARANINNLQSVDILVNR